MGYTPIYDRRNGWKKDGKEIIFRMEKLITTPRPILQRWKEIGAGEQVPNTGLYAEVDERVSKAHKCGNAHRILSRAASGGTVTEEEKGFVLQTLGLPGFPYWDASPFLWQPGPFEFFQSIFSCGYPDIIHKILHEGDVMNRPMGGFDNPRPGVGMFVFVGDAKRRHGVYCSAPLYNFPLLCYNSW